MSSRVIRVENLSKKYIIRHQEKGRSYKTLRDVLSDGAKSLTRTLLKPDKLHHLNPTREEFWALKDVSFEIKQGDRIGIIGRNGAGKSTLLKILSRITEPTRGRVSIRGRVASLLEVGTGFHPELTGRENIFLNGAILGMSKVEIKRKFDEIVAFAEVERFLNTPIKRYSSGMYVRLAFAVAAHLEPEILIVDEVLAVGDVSFQKKCLGKMQDVAENEGRTVLFVSHNMNAVQRLCPQSLIFEQGRLVDFGNTTRLVARYMSSGDTQVSPLEWISMANTIRSGTGEARFTAVKYGSLQESVRSQPYSCGPIHFLLQIVSDAERSINSLAVILFDQSGTKLVNADTLSLGQTIFLKRGRNVVHLQIEHLYLNPGIYVFGLWLANPERGVVFDHIESAFEIEVIDVGAEQLGTRPDFDGAVVCPFKILTKEQVQQPV
ncbi:ABC transporter ATP-binding protein [Leptolyngbya sp. ST-U4]|uniref:ABC transporter ATP-binding protein n=1 Tax=Leptolyngbya sp. ST-U4 TaxID=2933912 RepID=UPI003296EE16